MRLTVRPIVIPLAVGLAAAVMVAPTRWEQWRTGLVPALSVIAAGVLVRLARGLPFANPDHFELEKFRQVSATLGKIAGALRMLIYVSLTAMVAVILVPSISAFGRNELLPDLSEWLDRGLSFIVGYTLTYAFVRVTQVVEGDISLLRLQSTVMEQAISKKNASSFKKGTVEKTRNQIAGAEKFGTTAPPTD